MLPDRHVCRERRYTVEGKSNELDIFLLILTFILQTLEQKKVWNTHFDAHLRNLDKTKPVIWTGDLNVAPTELGMFLHPLDYYLDVSLTSHADLTNAKKNWNKTAGYTEVETTAFKNILELREDPDANKFVDVWRNMHPEDQQYTYFSYRFDCRVKGIGWRLDMCMFFIWSHLNLVKPIFNPLVVLSERLSDRAKMVRQLQLDLKMIFLLIYWVF